MAPAAWWFDDVWQRALRWVAALGVVLLGIAAVGWPDALRAWNSDRLLQAAQRHGPMAIDGAVALRDLVRQMAGQPEAARLVAVNDFFNRRVMFMDDVDIWGTSDYWASPLEMLGRGRGDCEDYAIAKYFSLLASGVPLQRLRLVYVRAQMGGPNGLVMPHLVLAYYATPSADPWVLDNLIPELRPASQRPDLTPIWSFNSQGLWEGVNGAAAGDPLQRLSKWRDVVAKARAEGFE
jgi:predicted transglutaminase-like cysteine proteinase